MTVQKEFGLRKKAVLTVLASDEKDKSRKGGVDPPIADLISRINSHPSFFTTSSCSGRVSVFLEQASSTSASLNLARCHTGGSNREKTRTRKGGEWIFVSHEPAEVDEVVHAVRRQYEDAKLEGLLVFRFEPFILALECCSVAAAQQLVTCAQASGYRESGMSSVGKRIIVAVRSSIRLEVPIGEKGQLIVPEEYLRYLTVSANTKLALNQQRIDRFLCTFIEQVDNRRAQPLEDNTGESMKAFGPKLGHKRRKGITSELLDKLLSSLEKRQSNILSRVHFLEERTDTVYGGLKDKALSNSDGRSESRKG